MTVNHFDAPDYQDPHFEQAEHPQYMESLRTMFLKINPSHFSCPYKEMLEKNSVKNLADCEDEFDIYAEHKIRKDKKEQHASNDSSDDASDDDQKRTKRNENLMTSFFNKIRVELPTPENKSLPISPWNTCQFNHCDQISPNYMAMIQPVATSAGSQSPLKQLASYQSYSPTRIGSSKGSSKSDTYGSPTASQRDLRVDIGASRSGHSRKSDTTSGAKWSKSPAPKTKKPHKDKRIMFVPTDCSYLYTNYGQDIKYNFIHNTDWSDHMDQYRHQYTHRRLLKEYYPYDIDIMNSQRVPKCGVNCFDVREGASVVPVVTCQYKFNVNNKLRIASGKKSGSVSPKQRMSPRNTPSPSMPSRKILRGRTSGKSRNAYYDSSPTSVTPQPSSSPIPLVGHDGKSATVVRSRPSIPSNARGIVCDSAIETPIYSVSGVKGRCVQDKEKINALRKPKPLKKPIKKGFNPQSTDLTSVVLRATKKLSSSKSSP